MKKMGLIHYNSSLSFVIIIILGFVLLFSLTSSADTISVDINGGEEYTSIQDAINAANESDTIEVSAGTYEENILINKTLNIIGSGKQSTFLIGIDDMKNTVKITANNIYLSGFSIDNTIGKTKQYHCIFIQSIQSGTISDNLVKNGENGIYVISSEGIEIYENTIENNNQKGIRLSTSNSNIIRDNIIQDNGDGIYTTTSDSNDIYENVILNNGVGIYLASGCDSNSVYKNDFDDNTGGNAADSGSNSWSENNQGNYWDDYHDYDSNEDGVGDNPYIIDQNSQDDYPLGDFLIMDQEPVAYIDSISPDPAIDGESVSFHGHGADDGSIIEWEWKSSKDGVFGTSADCSSSSLSVGSHTISFRVRDDSLQWSSYVSSSLTIQSESTPQSSNQRPVANISLIEPLEGTLGEEISFHGYGTDADGTIIGYQWRSSLDEELSSQSSFSTTSLSKGTHTIYFKVKDNNNSWSVEDSMTMEIMEIEMDNEIPVPDFTIPVHNSVNSSILFDASNSYDSDGTIASYEWDFGDNQTGSGKIIAHSYLSQGNYTVTLTVTDDEGDKQKKTTVISITAKSSDNTSDNQEPDNSGSVDDPIEFSWILIIGVIITVVLIGTLIILILRR